MTDERGQEPRRRFSWPVAFAVVAVVTILAATGVALYVIRVTHALPGQVMEGGRAVLKDLQNIAQAFHSGTVTTSFISYATEMEGSSYLQFLTLKEVEVFERKDSAATFWGLVQLPDVVVRARAPVEYTYYVDFDKKWDLRLEQQTIRVVAPPIEFNMPAIDASEIRFDVVAGSVLRDEAAAIEALRNGLTQASKLRARENIPLIRELGRKQTAEFVEKWLAHSFSDATSYRVVVFFSDEVARPNSDGVRPR